MEGRLPRAATQNDTRPHGVSCSMVVGAPTHLVDKDAEAAPFTMTEAASSPCGAGAGADGPVRHPARVDAETEEARLRPLEAMEHPPGGVPHPPPASSGEEQLPLTSSWRDWKRWILRWIVDTLRDPERYRDRRRATLTCVTALTILAAGGAGHRRLWRRRESTSTHRSALEAPLSLLLLAAREGRIRRALLDAGGAMVYFLLRQDAEDRPRWRRARLPASVSPQDLVEKSLAGCPDVSVLPESLVSRSATALLAALPFAYLGLLYQFFLKPMICHQGDDILQASSYDSQRDGTRTTFRDVAGLDPVARRDVAEVVAYLRDPEAFRRIGARPPRGLLLHGPPGTGKTLLARALAGEAAGAWGGCAFRACSASDFVEVYVGRGAARVRALFQRAREEAVVVERARYGWWDHIRPGPPAAHRPAAAILFIDELDALAKTRATMNSNDEREQTLNQLLVELDGFRKEDENVTLVVVAASNRVDVLDPAVLRRFDRQVHVGLPDASGREEILKLHARQVRCASDIVWARIASDALTNGFSGADLKNLINESALLAVREQSHVVDITHMEWAARRLNRTKRSNNT